MQLYRIVPEEYLEIYSGLGSSYKDGARWNFSGLPVIYFALSASTALLEMANYLPTPRLVPKSYRLGIYELPDEVPLHTLSEECLPGDWAEFPYPISTQEIGSDWINKNNEVGMLVPSTAVPIRLEKILVFNPNNKNSDQIKLINSTSDLYNQRSFEGI